MLRASSLELLLFGVLYMVIFLIGRAPFVLGGAIACLALSLSHHRLSRRHEKLRAVEART